VSNQNPTPGEIWETIRAELAEANPDALLLDGFEHACIGIARRVGQPALSVYERDACINILVLEHDLDLEEAVEHFDFNVAGGWLGEHTPIIMNRPQGNL
jgi:hypothetical protein